MVRRVTEFELVEDFTDYAKKSLRELEREGFEWPFRMYTVGQNGETIKVIWRKTGPGRTKAKLGRACPGKRITFPMRVTWVDGTGNQVRTEEIEPETERGMDN